MYKHYIFMRSDLDSMTPGKVAAQAAHAASQLVHMTHDSIADVEYVFDWMQGDDRIDSPSSETGFGTTIVLDGGNLMGVDITDLFDYVYDNVEDAMSEHVIDPSYPVRDGAFTHLVKITTCSWIFADPDTDPILAEKLSKFRLYSGNGVVY